jgi:hypothetical protein
MAAERDNLLADLWRESWDSWVAMPRWAQVVLIAGFVVHTGAVIFKPAGMPYVVMAALRIGGFMAIVVGLVENAKVLDEFYTRVYLEACAISLVLSSIVLYAGAEFGIKFGSMIIGVLYASFVLGFVVAFARLRRA